MSLKFGTSGLRGLVVNMTDRECYLFARAFFDYARKFNTFNTVCLGGDYRASTPRILRAVAFAARKENSQISYQGILPTPALTLFGISRGLPSIMVTGSHIPDDRNGIKFNLVSGEILKRDEVGIMAAYERLKREEAGACDFSPEGSLLDRNFQLPSAEEEAMNLYRDRYLGFFGSSRPLEGARVVFYQHSSASREIIPLILEQLGVEVIRKGFSDRFVAVDTEAVEDLEKLADWVQEEKADALFSTDGDGDRPLVLDELGRFIRGDILGIAVARFLGIEAVATPVNSTSSLELCGSFARIVRTRIGSPYVVEGMSALAEGGGSVAGFEANGGFLTATTIRSWQEGGNPLQPLPTRDAALPVISVLTAAKSIGRSVSGLIDELPSRYSDGGLTRPVPTEAGKRVMEQLLEGGKAALEDLFGETCGTVESTDLTDGYRVVFSSGDIVHFRPSGNAPEFRCYAEAESRRKAAELAGRGIEWVRRLVRGQGVS